MKEKESKTRTLKYLQQIFDNEIDQIKAQYPTLTELDIQVLTLLGLGVSNYEILDFVDMSKRTYYKRRQIIAGRMGTSAAQLDALAKELIHPTMESLKPAKRHNIKKLAWKPFLFVVLVGFVLCIILTIWSIAPILDEIAKIPSSYYRMSVYFKIFMTSDYCLIFACCIIMAGIFCRKRV